MLLGGGSNTVSEIKFLNFGNKHMSIYNNSGGLSFANTSATAQTNTLGTPLMFLNSSGTLNMFGNTIQNVAQINNGGSGVQVGELMP